MGHFSWQTFPIAPKDLAIFLTLLVNPIKVGDFNTVLMNKVGKVNPKSVVVFTF